MIRSILGIAAISLLFVLPVQAAGQEIFTRDLCKNSPASYKEIVKTHKESGFDAARAKFLELMTTPGSGCYALPQGGRIAVTVLETVQRDTLFDTMRNPSCVTIHRVKLRNQTDPNDSFYTVMFYTGSCDRNEI